MKAFSLFVIVIMLFCSFDLCKDEDECAMDLKIELAKEKHKQSNEKETCSPLCTCANCFFSVLLPVQQIGPSSFPTVLKHSSSLHGEDPIDANSLVWQPPQNPA